MYDCLSNTHTHTHTHTQGFQAQLSSLERQRKELQEALQSRSPEALAFQRQRQQYRDKIMGLAACLAGLRTNLNITSKSLTSQEEAFSERNKKVEVSRLWRIVDHNVPVPGMRHKVSRGEGWGGGGGGGGGNVPPK